MSVLYWTGYGQETNGQGASPRELVVEACRRDQPHLIEQVLEGMGEKSNEEVAAFFNSVTDALGNHALHICAMYGSCTFPFPFPPTIHRRVLMAICRRHNGLSLRHPILRM